MSLAEKITCPHCSHKFELSEAFSYEIELATADRIQKEFSKKEEQYKNQLKAADHEKNELLKRNAKEQVQLRLELEEQLTLKINNQLSFEQEDLKAQLAEKTKQAEESSKNELTLRAKQRDLEQKSKDIDLEIQRKLSIELDKVTELIKRQADDDSNLKLAEKNKQIETLNKSIDDLKRKTHVTSQQLQGEVLELKVEDNLNSWFPEDTIVEVKKGAKGADITQEVRLQSGRTAGKILFECKQAGEWSAQWTAKLKDDMREAGCDLAVIVSTVLPKGVHHMDVYDGVWVCNQAMLKSLVMLLREQLLKVAKAELVMATPQDQRDLLFKYMTSPKFAQKIQAICENTQAMKETLDSEKRSIQKNWKRRESEIEGIETQMINLYGELEGVVGKALPKVEAFELDYKRD